MTKREARRRLAGRIVRMLSLGAAVAWSALAPVAVPVGAEISGSCAASINGVDVAGVSSSNAAQAVPVAADASVAVRLQAPSPMTRVRVGLEFAGLRWTVFDQPVGAAAWQDSVPVASYARFGVGLYRVVGESEGNAGPCQGAALVRVAGDPLHAAAGIAGAAIAAFGALWLLVTSATAAIRGRAAGVSGLVFSGFLGGAMIGAGAIVLLQQYGLVYPTPTVALVALGAGAIVGVLLPLLLRGIRGA